MYLEQNRLAGHLMEDAEPEPRSDLDAPVIRYLRMRRAGELALLLATLPLTLAVAALIALAVRLDSPGPLLYRQLRPGRRGIPFPILKFRSMIAESEGSVCTSVGDPRITRVGRFIRRTRLDEIPQLWNIVRGEMSLIGPRPEPMALSAIGEQGIPGYRSRWVIRPGLTGWAQVEQGYTDGIDELRTKLEFDLYYIRHISPGLDARILLKTIRTVITGAGAR